MTPWIKICGLTRAADAHLAVDLGADALGFVLHQNSPRRCNPIEARAIIRGLPRSVVTVAVWLDEPFDVVVSCSRSLGSHMIQTYRQDVALALKSAGLDVLPAGRMASSPRECESWKHFLQSWSGLVLLDRRHRGSDENRVGRESSVSDAVRISPQRTILAGGLTSETVRAELEAFRPRGVDVASGVESEPGKKCKQKLAEFIKEARG